MAAGSAVESLLSVRGKSANEARPMTSGSGVISFTSGFPDPAKLPLEGIAEATERTMSTHGQWPLQYGPVKGYDGLITLLVEKMRKNQGIDCGKENLILTSGGSQALALLLDLFVDPGDTILTEMPTWSGAVRAFKNVNAKVEGIPLDDDGVQVDVLEQKLQSLRQQGISPKVFYMIPTFQNPGGMTTTRERREKIVALAKEYNFVVLEDDAYYDLRFEGEPVTTLYELAGGENVLYFGTFSKILAAGMRLGWIVGAPELITRLGILKVDGSTNPFAAHVAYEYCKDGVLEQRIDDLITLYRDRRNLMIGELNERMPEGVTWRVPEGGFFIWLELPEALDSTKLLAQCKERGVEFLAGTACFPNGEGKRQIRLSFSYVTNDEMVQGLQILCETIAEAAQQ